VPKPNSSSQSAIDIGSVIADTYRIEALIGRGGMGSVFLASHARLPGKQVAIKVLHTGIDDADVIARFRREAEIASRLGHPNIVNVEDFNVTADGMSYLVLEYLKGMTLADRIAAGPMPVEQTMSILRQVGSALAAAHREGIVHRDLKPQNIFLVQTEVAGKSVEVAKVLDFGISKIRGSQTVKTQETALLGTPQYMSPEQATGHHNAVDERTDVFAMGAIVHEMLCGSPAFTGASIPEVVFKVVYEPAAALPETIPPEISGAVKKAMSKAQPERFPSMSSFIEALTGMPLASPRDIVPPTPPSAFAAGSKHTYNNAGAGHASTLASGDHGDSIAKALSSTQASGGAGMASTALGVAVPRPAVQPPVGINVPTVSTIVPNAQQSLQGVAAEARANKVATDSRSIWTKILLAAPVAAVAVIALVMFTGKKGQNAYDTSSAQSVRTGVIAAGSGNATPTLPPAQTTEPVTVEQPKRLIAPDSKGDGAKPDPAKPDDKPGASGKATKPPAEKPTTKTTVKPPPPTKNDEPEVEDAWKTGPLASAHEAEVAGDTKLAIRRATAVIGDPGVTEMQRARAHFMRGRLYCKQGDMEKGGADQAWLDSNNNLKLATKLSNVCK
jgi:serine/threonine-protein kinase